MGEGWWGGAFALKDPLILCTCWGSDMQLVDGENKEGFSPAWDGRGEERCNMVRRTGARGGGLPES